MVDRTPPLAGTVNDGERVGTDIDYTSSTSMLCVNWQGFSDPESGISAIRWTIGKHKILSNESIRHLVFTLPSQVAHVEILV